MTQVSLATSSYVLPAGRHAGKRVSDVVLLPDGKAYLATYLNELNSREQLAPKSLSKHDKMTLIALRSAFLG